MFIVCSRSSFREPQFFVLNTSHPCFTIECAKVIWTSWSFIPFRLLLFLVFWMNWRLVVKARSRWTLFYLDMNINKFWNTLLGFTIVMTYELWYVLLLNLSPPPLHLGMSVLVLHNIIPETILLYIIIIIINHCIIVWARIGIGLHTLRSSMHKQPTHCLPTVSAGCRYVNQNTLQSII